MADIPVYVVANFTVQDAATYREYEKGFFPILKRHEGTFFTYDDNTVTFEGANPREGRMVMFSFPSEAHAVAWYNDPDYQALSEEEMAAYRAPFATPEDRQPTLNWPRQIPIEGEPAHMVELVDAYATFMASTDIPKLFVNADPGSILVGKQREFCRSWPNQTEVTVKGLHFVQEDSPTEIGQAVAAWHAGL